MPDYPYRSDCPIASTLDLIGDRWTLLILRDMFFGADRFSDFVAKAEGITRNILTDRLRQMEQNGLIYRQPYSDHPPRSLYRLTERGAQLLPVVQALAAWGAAQLDHTYDPPQSLMDWLPEDHIIAPTDTAAH
jgi:DNA-binding HxlR family transcriptional regulator